MASVSVSAHARISFSQTGRGLRMEIETDKLNIRSVEESDKPFYRKLFGSKEVMIRFSDGIIRAPESVDARVNNWIERWQKSDPFSAMVVFEKGIDKANIPIGHIVLGYGSESREAELAYLLMSMHWEGGYEEEMIKALIEGGAKELVKQAYSVNGGVLKNIITTVKCHNIVSINILDRLGMTLSEKKREQPASLHYAIQVG